MKDNHERNFALTIITVVVLIFITSMFTLGYNFNEFAKAQQEAQESIRSEHE